MKIPLKLAIIGNMDLLKYRYLPPKNRYACTFSPDDFLLLHNRDKTMLVAFKNTPTGGQKELRFDNQIVTGIEYDVPDCELRRIGTVTAMQYTTNMFLDDKNEKLEHLFVTPAVFYANKRSRFDVIAIKRENGGKIFDGETGITG